MPLPRFSLVLALAALLLAAAPVRADRMAEEAAAVRTLMARGELTQALQRAEKAATAQPGDAAAQFLLGLVLMEQGRDTEALALYIRMAESWPELPDPYNNIALLRARRGDYEAARLALEAALRNDPGHRIARANLGRVHLLLAVQAWEQLGAQGPLDVALQRQLDEARALLAGGAPRTAR
ncbi:TPR_REGION domain-containing protein [Rubrivivax sp. A210]|uniref:tetratricopeptide repeat protein n=1 Tax=Rubrivivax sp. A210 TaxID=2772301 RepID=UPI001918FC77|nr:tetratricopeptide repeat protein [Rubrivivax sp. A210]CAD5366146.1 TPR_REGION domain-containing protein [Rubrivivax sp. A210]